MEDPAGLAEWATVVPQAIRDDPLWRLPAYRIALFIGDLAQVEDAPRIQRDYRTRKHLDQFIDATGSISSNIAEGYGRTTGPDRAKFYEYALSSAREARDWYFKVRHALEPNVAAERIESVTRVMKILTVAIVRERAEPDTRARRAERERRGATRKRMPRDAASPSDQHERPASSKNRDDPPPSTQHQHLAPS